MMRLSVLLTRRWPIEAESVIAERYNLTVDKADRPLTARALAEALRSHDVVCPTVTDRIDGAMLSGAPCRTRALCNFGAGTSHIDVDACARAGLIVTNTPDVLTGDTADLAILLALMCARRAGEGERLVRRGDWEGWAPTHHLGSSLSGKTLGIVGLGRIGQATARRAHHGFDMPIIYSSRHRAAREVEQKLQAEWVPLDMLMQRSDVISLHLPGGALNRHLIDERRLSLMKPSAILVNTARGELVNEAALILALRAGEIAAAGLDVFAEEPAVSPLLTSLENVVLLPHLGSATVETRLAMGLRAINNLDAIVAGREPPDRVA